MIVLCGESASGKSSILKYLVDNFNFQNIITYTTRSPRQNERNNIDYNFIDIVQFKQLKEHGFFAETAIYNNWYYGSAKQDYIENNQNKVVILTPHGIRQVRKNNIDIYTVYINIPRRDRLVKILQRGDDIEESYRRNLSDVGQFDGIEDEVDLVIKNDGYEKSVKDIASIIYYDYMDKINKDNQSVTCGTLNDSERVTVDEYIKSIEMECNKCSQSI